MRKSVERGKQQGFTLLETMVALCVLGIGLIALAAMLAGSMAYMNSSQADFIAQQKASEAIESIFTARDTQAVTYAQIQNVSTGGIFLDGPENLIDPGADGVVDTADDNAALPDTIIKPGPDGILGTADDVAMSLGNFTRQIQINTVLEADGVTIDPNLKQIVVTVSYSTGTSTVPRTYSVNALISAFH